ncbi:MAG: restriction endonuclease subunit S, partial [Olsenella sp.]
ASELKLYPAGTLLMVTRSGILRHTLPVSMLRKPSTVNQDIRTISTNKDCSSLWLMQHLKARSKELLLEYGKTGTTVESIDFAKMKSMTFMLPTPSEQKAIGELFQQLDDLITLHQRKHDKLTTLKKSMLDKMFPKEGADVPEIRFAGFTDPWEQRKLGDVTEVTSGQSPNGANYTDNPADHILVQGNADLKNHWVVPRVWTTEVTKTATPDDLIFSVRAPVGEIGRTAFPVVIGRGVASIRGGDYLYAYLEHLGESGYWSSVSAGSTFDAIGGDELRATAIWLPNNGEQRKIGAFFQQLDNLITLHQRQLDSLKKVKRSCLDKMFV